MSKVTFRADDDLVGRIEALDASKSEVMRDALREYLDRHHGEGDEESAGEPASTDEALATRVDELIAERLDEYVDSHDSTTGASTAAGPRELTINVTVDGEEATVEESTDAAPASAPAERKTQQPAGDAETICNQCGETIDGNDVYCPNCGEKRAHRVFCECGDEVRSDWAFCPSCGRRTPAADVLERS